jgi:hypothetical protein
MKYEGAWAFLLTMRIDIIFLGTMSRIDLIVVIQCATSSIYTDIQLDEIFKYHYRTDYFSIDH